MRQESQFKNKIYLQTVAHALKDVGIRVCGYNPFSFRRMSDYSTNIITGHSLIVNRILISDWRNVETLRCSGRIYVVRYDVALT